MKHDTPLNSDELRRQAEELLSGKPASGAGKQCEEGAEGTAELLHELQVHQIELEMQNEEMRKAQNEIETGLARYFDLYDMAPVGYVTVGGKGLILEANLTAATMLGVNRDSLVRQPLTRFILREDQDGYYLFRRRLSETLSAGAELAGLPQRCELRMVKPDEGVFWVRLDATATEGPDGTPAFRIVLSDITERKRVEEHVASMVEMLDTAPTSITVHDFDGRFLYANRRTFEMHGYEASEFMSLPLHELDVPESADLIAGRMQLIREKGEATFEVSHLHKSGIPIQLEVFAKTVEWQGKPALLSIATDITARVQAEEAIRRAERRSGALIDNAPDGIVFVSIDGKFTYASPSTFKIFGYDTDDISLLDPDVLTHPDDLPSVLAVMIGVIQDPSLVTTLQYRFRHQDGRWLWIESTFSNLIAEPSIQAIVINFRDITARRQAEETVSSYAVRLNLSMKAANLAWWEMDLKTGHVVFDERKTEMLGYAPEDFHHYEDFMALVHPDDHEKAMDAMRAHLSGAAEKYEVEYRILTKEGRYKWFYDIGTIEKWDAQGEPLTVAGIVIDITARKRAEVELHESKQILESVIENIPLMIFLKESQDLRFIIFNKAGEDLLGYNRSDLLGKNNLDLFPPEQAAHFSSKDREVLASGVLLDIPKEPILTLKKGERFLHTRKVCIEGADGTAKYLLGISEDITEREVAEEDRRKLEEQLRQAQKMEAVGRLAGGVAHDFNNLIMIIMGNVDLCRDRIGPDHPIHELLDEITGSAQRSAEITRQLLAFARRQTIAPKILNLTEAVEGMLKLLQRLIGEDIKLTWRPGSDLLPVKIDPSQVDQILANLCVNARDAISDVGEVTVKTGSFLVDAEYCTSHPEAVPGRYVFLAVSDDGCGMDQETLTQVFEPFFTTKGLGDGTGLGLATVYGIVKQNNGFINATSEPGNGTTFTAFLPQAESDSVETPATAAAEAPRGSGETVLLVEDERSVSLICRTFLEALDYNVLTAETPGEALKISERHTGKIHVLLTDVVMPGMDGRQLANRINAIKPGVKVLFMSGYTADVIAQRGVLDEGVQFLLKPFSREDLARKLQEMLLAD
jgi:PAS domain S-box-containing protein